MRCENTDIENIIVFFFFWRNTHTKSLIFLLLLFVSICADVNIFATVPSIELFDFPLRFESFSDWTIVSTLNSVFLLIGLIDGVDAFETCWFLIAELWLISIVWSLFSVATFLLSMSCCVCSIFFVIWLWLVAWFESELSGLQYSCWSPLLIIIEKAKKYIYLIHCIGFICYNLVWLKV